MENEEAISNGTSCRTRRSVGGLALSEKNRVRYLDWPIIGSRIVRLARIWSRFINSRWRATSPRHLSVLQKATANPPDLTCCPSEFRTVTIIFLTCSTSYVRRVHYVIVHAHRINVPQFFVGNRDARDWHLKQTIALIHLCKHFTGTAGSFALRKIINETNRGESTFTILCRGAFNFVSIATSFLISVANWLYVGTIMALFV